MHSSGNVRRRAAVALVSGMVAAGAWAAPTAATSGATTRVSVASDGTPGDQQSGSPAVSGNGRFVAFQSRSANLVPGDTNGAPDLFVHDRKSGATKRVSVASDGTQADQFTIGKAALSADGRYVAFSSFATNLTAGDTNGSYDVFVHELPTGLTTRVSVGTGGTGSNGASHNPAISADGRYVAFDSTASNLVPDDTNLLSDVFVHDRQTATTTRGSLSSSSPVEQQGLGVSTDPALSGDGRFVAFSSTASNLVVGDTNNAGDVFVRDRQTGSTTRVSVASDGTQGSPFSQQQPSISADGRYVAFESQSSNLVAGDTNGAEDIFLHDRQTGATTRVSVAPNGAQASGSDGVISGDGLSVAFESAAGNLVVGDTNSTDDVFVKDVQSGATTRVSVGDDGRQSNSFSRGADVSADGRYVAFESRASNLVAGDTNENYDVFVHDRQGVPGPRPVLVAVGEVSVYEGDAGGRAAVFTVSLSEPSAAAVSVNFATLDGAALGGADYKSRAGTLSFPPGTTSLPVKVPVLPDTADESGETFTLAISGAVGASIADPSGAGTIIDDDPASVIGRRLAIGDATVYEGEAGGRTAAFNVSLSTPASSPVTVEYATADGSATEAGDYAAKAGTLSFAPGTTSLAVKITVNPDTTGEPHEGFRVVLSNVSGPKTAIFDGTGTGTIVNDD